MSGRPGSGPADPARLAGLLAEDDRRRVFAAVVLGAATLAEVAAASGLEAKQAQRALERLAAGGVVVQAVDGGGFTVAGDVFKDAARAAAPVPVDARAEFEWASAEDVPVLAAFVRADRLLSIPTQHRKRLVVLDWLARRFEPGKIYPERDVNLLLGMAHADVAALRRYLVDHEFLERRDGFYWRAGGTVEIEPIV